MRINDWPLAERPRERLLEHGPGTLSDAELLDLVKLDIHSIGE